MWPTLEFARNHGLSIALLGIFLILAVSQTIVGRRDLNGELRERRMPEVTYLEYLLTGTCWESLSENWESEFLEMGAFVWLTAFLYQRGSPQSDDPDDPDAGEKVALTGRSPWPARRGGWVRAVYARSLSLAFLLLFLGSFLVHAASGASAHNLLHPGDQLSALQFMGTSTFWFQSLQNWQSEFLGIGCMVILSVWLRHEGSAESKPVNAPHASNS